MSAAQALMDRFSWVRQPGSKRRGSHANGERPLFLLRTCVYELGSVSLAELEGMRGRVIDEAKPGPNPPENVVFADQTWYRVCAPPAEYQDRMVSVILWARDDSNDDTPLWKKVVSIHHHAIASSSMWELL